MPDFTTRLSDGWGRAGRHLPLALVPLLFALLSTDKIAAVTGFDGAHVGVRIGFPADVVSVWQFVGVPGQGAHVTVGGPTDPPLAYLLLPAVVAVKAALAAGYFGSIRDLLVDGTYDFAENVGRYFAPFLVYVALPVLVIVPLSLSTGGSADFGSGFAAVVLLLLPVVLVVAYLFWATPYLIVLREDGLVAAARASYGLAVAGGAYLSFSLGFAAFVLLASIPVSAVVVNLGPAGVLIGSVAVAPVGLACNVAAMRFVADIDAASPTPISWGSSASDDPGGPTAGVEVQPPE